MAMYSFFVLFSSALLIGDGQAIRDTGVSARGLNASTTAYGSSALGQTASRGPNATSGSPSSLSCGDAWMSWLNRSTRYIPTWTSYVDTYTYHNITAATATGCDGHPRVVGGSGALTTVATGTNITSTSASKNFTVPTPTCQLSPSECTGKLALYSLCTGVSTTSSSDCGVCSIWGGTVQLNYFPITRNATQNLCRTGGDGSPTLCPLAPTGTPYSVANPFGMTPCDYKTDNITSTRNSGPYLVSNGQTFYQNRVYISLDTVYASNSCGYVGKQYAGTTLTLASSDIYSVHGYHHEFEDVGYQFDFADLSSVPAEKYYANCGGGQDPICVYSGTDYRYGRDFINGRSDIDFGVGYAVGDGHTETAYQWIWQGAYSPTLLVPLQIRTLDPAWRACSLNLVGLYDPPRVLTGQLTYATPTAPTVPKTTEATPAATATSDGAPATAAPKPTRSGQEGPEYTTPTYTYDPLPTASADGDHPSGEQSQPANEDQNSSPEAIESPAVPPTGQPPDQGTPVIASLPSGDKPEGGDPPATPDGPLATAEDQPTQMTLSEELPHSMPSTMSGVGDVLASVFSMRPAPTTTTNALSVLESAGQTFDGDDGGTTVSVPVDASPQETSRALQPPQPITFSDGGQTHTLEPLTSIDGEGLYTITTASPDRAGGIGFSTLQSDHLPSTPLLLATDGSTQTLDPVQGVSGLYTLVTPSITTDVDSLISTYPSTNGPEESSSVPPFYFTGPATFIANDGETHTIRPMRSSSGVFVVDGSRTVTQLLPSSGGGAASSRGHGPDDGGGSSNGASTIVSLSGELPALVTATSGGSVASSSSASGGSGRGGSGGGDADVLVKAPPQNAGVKMMGGNPMFTGALMLALAVVMSI